MLEIPYFIFTPEDKKNAEMSLKRSPGAFLA
jgi:hypothetical protein